MIKDKTIIRNNRAWAVIKSATYDEAFRLIDYCDVHGLDWAKICITGEKGVVHTTVCIVKREPSKDKHRR